MTDITDFDVTADARPESRREPLAKRIAVAPRREYYAYFAIIFVATLPLAFVTWTLSALRQFRIPDKNPISKAWSQARIITPMIFQG